MSNPYDQLEEGAMPAAPAEEATSDPGVEIDGSVGDAMEDVPKMGEVIPAGTYHFRAGSYVVKISDKDDAPGFDKQPYFIIGWICQQEPHAGKRYADFVPWVSKQVINAVKQGDPNARAVLKERLQRARAIMDACGVPLNSDFVQFLTANPEVKIPLGVGTNKKTKELVNQNMKYLPLHGGRR